LINKVIDVFLYFSRRKSGGGMVTEEGARLMHKMIEWSKSDNKEQRTIIKE